MCSCPVENKVLQLNVCNNYQRLSTYRHDCFNKLETNVMIEEMVDDFGFNRNNGPFAAEQSRGTKLP